MVKMERMTDLRFFAVTRAGPQSLPVPAQATGFDDLYDGLPVGVYSALRTFEHNKFLGLAGHLARTERSMALLGWDYTLDKEALRRALHEVCTAVSFPDSRVRYDVLAAPARQLGAESRVLLAVLPPERLYREGVGLQLAPALHRENPLAKTADFAQRRRTYPPGDDDIAHEYLLLNAQGELLECTSVNFYGVRSDVVYTADEGILEGITRQILLDLMAELRIPVVFEPIHKNGIDRLDEAAISSSSRGWLPVTHIAGTTIGDGRPGPVSQQLIPAYADYLARHIKPAIPL